MVCGCFVGVWFVGVVFVRCVCFVSVWCLFCEFVVFFRFVCGFWLFGVLTCSGCLQMEVSVLFVAVLLADLVLLCTF